ncbi:MAG: alkane 1-monooxygenase [Pseudomonadales bacterium]|nr:alkane 1-monooxygenase [Pseudomonadales bacterium]
MPSAIYLLAYILPITCLMGFAYGGFFTAMTVIVSFGLLPILDQFFPQNNSYKDRASESQIRFYTQLLYSNIFWVYGCLLFGAYQFDQSDFSAVEQLFLVLSLGIVLGSNGINVAHELGHRSGFIEQRLALLLLLPSFYMHFSIEHNRGHHKNVATPQDPATARKNETLYSFWLRSVVCAYASAWSIQSTMLKKQKQTFLCSQNKMLIYTIVQLGYVMLLFVFLESGTAALLILSGVVGFLLLETINYIEHYGLLRNKREDGRYERVQPCHSWNANYTLGRIFLFELTRHSDHHYLARKPYYELQNIEGCPQLPVGYPLAMLMASVPPLWFKVINPHLD